MPSAKAREFAIWVTQPLPITADDSSPCGELAPALVLSGGSGSPPDPLSPSEVEGLRNEVENLRLVVQSLNEPPPVYTEGSQIVRSWGPEERAAGERQMRLPRKRREVEENSGTR